MLRTISRRKVNVYKNTFGHALILAGSGRMLGAAALSSLAAMRTGCGLVTLGVPQSLNAVAQKKISNVIMTLPLKETKGHTIASSAFCQIQENYSSYDVIAIGPGLSIHLSTKRFIYKIIESFSKPLIIDADALNVLSGNVDILTKTKIPKILTPHPGEMARLTGLTRREVQNNRKEVARDFAQKYNCVLLLKGHQTIVASPERKIYVNKTGNPGMATAGSGDVLTGMITAFVAQGISVFEAAKLGAYWHGKAGDLAAQSKGRISLIASDILEAIAEVLR